MPDRPLALYTRDELVALAQRVKARSSGVPMDPDKNLKEMLDIAIAIADGDTDVCGELDFDACANRLAELVIAMHEWMIGGGFPPDLWKFKR